LIGNPLNFTNTISPFLKWPGGKSSELEKIIKFAPVKFERFIDPFVGGGSVLLAVNSDLPALINDVCPELIHLYEVAKTVDREFEDYALKISHAWASLSSIGDPLNISSLDFFETAQVSSPHLLSLQRSAIKAIRPFLQQEDLIVFTSRLEKDVPKKIERMGKLQVKNAAQLSVEDVSANLEGTIKSCFYMTVRDRYNRARLTGMQSRERDCDFYFLREFAYASMFRFNLSNEFNVPYGGVSYNGKKFEQKFSRLYADTLHLRLTTTSIFNLDWKLFLETVQPTSQDFMFVDPPYDSDFSKYDNREFDASSQRDLANVLSGLSCQIMIVIGDTPLIRNLYTASHWNIIEDEITYKWTIKSRNERSKNHLTIRNFTH